MLSPFVVFFSRQMLRAYGIGSVLNESYRLERELGRGNLGSVFAGSDLNRGGECAIRVLPPAAVELQGERERFLRDHRIISKSNEPRLPGIIDLAITNRGAEAAPGTVPDNLMFIITAL